MLKKKIKERGWHKYTNYVIEGFGLTIEAKYIVEESKGFLTSWQLVGQTRTYRGDSVSSLIDTFNLLIKEYDLKKESENTKDTLLIFTDSSLKVYGFLQKYVTDSFGDYYDQYLDFIEVRECWRDDKETAEEIADWAQAMIDNVFVPYKYFHITPNQVLRRLMMHDCRKEKNEIAKLIFPDTYSMWKFHRKALFGGICYCPYGHVYDEYGNITTKAKVILDKLMCLDIKSAYIWCLLVMKHCMSASKEVDVAHWEYYLDSTEKGSIGTYVITFSYWSSKIRCFKDKYGNKIENEGRQTLEFAFDNVDLKTFIELVNPEKVECTYLLEYDMDYLPKYARDNLIKAFIDKEEAKDLDDLMRKIKKIMANGGYGDTIRRLHNRDEWKDEKDNTILAPQWGIWTCSYCKRLLLSLALSVELWVYSDTDSIYCAYNKHNLELLEETNNKIRVMTKEFCERFGYDYEKLKDLGTFKIEHIITKFKANKPKQYMFVDDQGKMYVKAAGCNKNSIPMNDKLFDEDKIQVGKRTFADVYPDHIEADIDGVHYEADGYYFEWSLSNEKAEAYMELQALLYSDDT